MRLIALLLLLLLLAACAGEFTPTPSEAPPTELPPSLTPSRIPPSATITPTRRPTLSPEEITRLPSIRELPTLPSYTPTFTRTPTQTPTQTRTPTQTFTPSPIPEAELCTRMVAFTLNPNGATYRGTPILFQFFVDAPGVSMLVSLVHVDSGESLLALTVPSNTFQPLAITTRDLRLYGRYEWTVTLFDNQRSGLCRTEGFFFIEPRTEATPEATAEVGQGLRPSR